MPTNTETCAMIERMKNFDFMGDSDFEVVVFSRDQNAPFEAAAMLRELLAEREWRDMDSAPRDGTEILVYTVFEGDDVFGIDPFSATQIALWDDGCPNADFYREAGWMMQKIGTPKKWLPLPTPETGE